MGEQRFEDLREALLRSGVAGRHVRRAILEIETHFQHLIDEERGRGADEQDARIASLRLLGSNDTLVRSYAARPELRAWAHRWPAVWFVVMPLISYVAVSAAAFLTVTLVAEHMAPYLHTIHVPARITRGIDFAARIVLLWIFPIAVLLTFSMPAYKRRAALRWPVVGIVLISVLVSLINVSVMFTGGPAPGVFGAGIGFSPQSLPDQAMRAAILASIAFMPLWLAARRARDCETT